MCGRPGLDAGSDRRSLSVATPAIAVLGAAEARAVALQAADHDDAVHVACGSLLGLRIDVAERHLARVLLLRREPDGVGIARRLGDEEAIARRAHPTAPTIAGVERVVRPARTLIERHVQDGEFARRFGVAHCRVQRRGHRAFVQIGKAERLDRLTRIDAAHQLPVLPGTDQASRRGAVQGVGRQRREVLSIHHVEFGMWRIVQHRIQQIGGIGGGESIVGLRIRQRPRGDLAAIDDVARGGERGVRRLDPAHRHHPVGLEQLRRSAFRHPGIDRAGHRGKHPLDLHPRQLRDLVGEVDHAGAVLVRTDRRIKGAVVRRTGLGIQPRGLLQHERVEVDRVQAPPLGVGARQGRLLQRALGRELAAARRVRLRVRGGDGQARQQRSQQQFGRCLLHGLIL